ncbi:conserved hypothetical protein [Talaromyces stipitatus ATCC 10500]|uniref:DNA ligase D 3'-phosphoesterase domain-containing protein n=1 Tax=Talaromyces stipitatus (strain ATCC 10500 / CBS 375.48 / QM 6759 / NRRL 1006) TaxID=441959 RepID=B8MB91_TALSN|nr:uncharacterized protein TSTA_125910 [Talaromyces stipitatus ATCC 10500]EED18880.1 conserved hypothetical protein [Talaromyces stipitatus ATCC 10500]
MKRSHSPETPRPFRNRNISQDRTRTRTLSSLTSSVSPPRLKKSASRVDRYHSNRPKNDDTTSLSLAAVEAGQVKIDDPVELFSARLAAASRPVSTFTEGSRLPVKDWIDLYSRNQHENGCHFVIHQHDHPIAGPHYDLRLQFSESSSLSWAIMYGLPGNPNSSRLNRNATETRVHCLWNHLIETGSSNTGSMIIWDTGEYEVLPYNATENPLETEDSASDASTISAEFPIREQRPSESEKLRQAFQNRKIRLRLHGTRLPKNYTMSLRLSMEDDNAARARPTNQKRRRRRINPAFMKPVRTPSTSRSPSPEIAHRQSSNSVRTINDNHGEEDIHGSHSASESESEQAADMKTRLTNAYPGAVNSIGSVHQRRWFITLDRMNSGFIRDSKRKIWKRKEATCDQDVSGFEPFYVRGPEFERSVVTGRTGNEVLKDENVEGFIPRRGWRPVLN